MPPLAAASMNHCDEKHRSANRNMPEPHTFRGTGGEGIAYPSNTYEHRWQVGDVLIWSNYSTMHRRDEFDKNSIRRMHRSQIKGTSAPVAYFQ
jgi:Taurine catabolism dioxygenase TauD, TfdA family